MTYKEVEEYIETAKKRKIIPGAGTLKELCRRLDEPQASLRFISVVGVKDRKSVTAYFSSILKSAGYKVGSYSLSAIGKERERIQVNGRPITKQDLCDKLQQVLTISQQMEEEGIQPLQLWEIETAIAFLYFKQKECDVIVWEGSYSYLREMTEVISVPLATICTTICADWMQHNGDTPEEIGEALAGVMPKAVPVISGKQLPKVEQVLRERTEAMGGIYYTIENSNSKKVKYGLEKQRFTYRDYKDLEISMGGKEEIENALLAVEAVMQLGQWKILDIGVSEGQIRKGLLQAKGSGSMSVLEKKPWFLLKEVGNEAEAKDLVESLTQYVPGKRMIFIMSSLRTMEYEAIIRRTVEMAEHVITLTVREDVEGMHAYELAGEIQPYHPSVTAVDSPEEARELAYLLADKDSVIVAFGVLECIDSLKTCKPVCY